MTPLARYAWRESRRRPARAALVFLGVVLGVAALVAASISTDAARDAYRDLYTSLAGRASLEVVAEGLGGFPDEVRERVERVPGVGAAVPVVVSPVAFVAPGPRTSVVLLGIDPARDAQTRVIEWVEGDAVGAGTADGDGGDGVVLLASFARDRGIRVGGSVRLATGTGTADFRVVGLARAPSLAAFPGGVVLMSLPAAQRRCGLLGRLSAVQVVASGPTGDADLDRLEAAITRVLPGGLRVQRPAARGLVAEGSLRSVEVGLSAVSLMSLVAALFVVGNAFSMSLAERRRSLATVRAIGGTRAQVSTALVLEALVLGVAGSAVGVVVGVVGARLLAAGLEQLLGVPLPAPRAAVAPIVVGLLVGPLATLGASVVPARRAARRDPLRDLLGAPETADVGTRRALGLVGLVMIAVTIAISVGFVRDALPKELVAPCVALAMLGSALAFPSLLPWLRRAVTALFEPIAGPAGGLGLRQLVRRPVHTALSSTVLFVAVMGGVGMGNEILSNVKDVERWARVELSADYFVRATMPESGTMITASMPDAIGDEIARLKDVERLDRIRFIPAVAGGVAVIVLAKTLGPPLPGRALDLDVEKTVDGAPLVALGPNETVIGTQLASRLSLEPGQSIVLSTRAGPKTLRIVATATEYTAGGQTLFVPWETARDAFGGGTSDAFMIVAKPGRRAAISEALAPICAREGLLLQSNADLAAAIDERVGGIVGLLWATLCVVFLVAAFGVVNTLTTNILDQTRAIGMLRAVGATRGQVATMVVAQAVGMAAMAVLPGALAGIGLSRLMNASAAPLRGFPVRFSVDVPLVLSCAGAAILLAVATAVAPAWRAARLEVAEALRYE